MPQRTLFQSLPEYEAEENALDDIFLPLQPNTKETERAAAAGACGLFVPFHSVATAERADAGRGAVLTGAGALAAPAHRTLRHERS